MFRQRAYIERKLSFNCVLAAMKSDERQSWDFPEFSQRSENK